MKQPKLSCCTGTLSITCCVWTISSICQALLHVYVTGFIETLKHIDQITEFFRTQKHVFKACKLPSGVRGRALENSKFGATWDLTSNHRNAKQNIFPYCKRAACHIMCKSYQRLNGNPAKGYVMAVKFPGPLLSNSRTLAGFSRTYAFSKTFHGLYEPCCYVLTNQLGEGWRWEGTGEGMGSRRHGPWRPTAGSGSASVPHRRHQRGGKTRTDTHDPYIIIIMAMPWWL